MGVLAWVMMLFLIVLYVTALFMTNIVGKHCDESYPSFELCKEMFGTMGGSMYSLFQVITLESWSMHVSRPVLRESPELVVIYVFFLCVTTFGLLNIVTGEIVENTLEASRNDVDDMKREAMEEALSTLKFLFSKTNADGSGSISTEEFIQTCEDERARSLLGSLNLNVASSGAARVLFQVLDYNRTGAIMLDKLVCRMQDLLADIRSMSSCSSILLIECRYVASLIKVISNCLEGESDEGPSEPFSQLAAMERLVLDHVGELEQRLHARLQIIEDHARQKGKEWWDECEENCKVWDERQPNKEGEL